MIDFDFRTPAERHCDDFKPTRPLGLFTQFTDLGGSLVWVQGSSLDTAHAMRIYTHRELTDDDLRAALAGKDVQVPLSVVRTIANAVLDARPEPHLCRAMAAELRDALDRFLASEHDADLECDQAAAVDQPR